MFKVVKLSTRWVILAVLLVVVWLSIHVQAMGECYANVIYPYIGRFVTVFSGLFPFSVSEVFVLLSVLGILVYLCMALVKRMPVKRVLLRVLRYLLWVYVWFYLVWGLNYARPNIYKRTGTQPLKYNQETFQDFLNGYVERLNQAYAPFEEVDKDTVHNLCVNGYKALGRLGIPPPWRTFPKGKTMLFSSLASMVGVTGSMAPFFCEYTVNGEVWPVDFPATYAHEMTHALGITNEAEASFYAYVVCTESQNKPMRFSGYYSVFGHVMANARRILFQEEYTRTLRSVRPEILRLWEDEGRYWADKYNTLVGSVQDWLYDLYLKGNKIPNGQKNYSQVVGLVVAYETATHPTDNGCQPVAR